MNRFRLLLIAVFFVGVNSCQSQDSTLASIKNLPSRYYSKLDRKFQKVNACVQKKSLRYLGNLEKKDCAIMALLAKNDSLKYTSQFKAVKSRYEKIRSLFKSQKQVISKLGDISYSSYLDSASSCLKFLKKYSGLFDKSKQSLSNISELQTQLKKSEELTNFIYERNESLNNLLKSSALGSSFQKIINGYFKKAFYYRSQIKEYKEILGDESKIEKTAVGLISKIPAFQKFFRENSQLSSLFGLNGPVNSNSSIALSGIQTRSTIQQLIQQQINIAGPNAQSQIQQNIAQAHSAVDQLKDRINKLGGSGEIDMPHFRPNSQKTKPLLKRLEYGLDIQFSKSTNFYPQNTEVGISVGFKLNDKSLIGLGMSNKIALGSFQHMNISYTGIGLRSFIDYKIKSSYYITGGFEENYNATFKDFDQLKHVVWQKAAMVGFSKKYQINRKVKGEFKLLYDFLANGHRPSSQPFVFSLGYKL